MLLKGLDNWLEVGENFFTKTEDDQQEKITKFIKDFSEYIDTMKNNGDYPTKVISQNIQKDKDNIINDLIHRLENWEEHQEEPENDAKSWEEDFYDETPITEQERNWFTRLLDDLLFELALPGTAKTPTNLKKIKDNLGLELDYKLKLEGAKNKGEIEIIRIKSIKDICEKISTQGGSDDELVEKVKKINKSFVRKIIQEIENEGVKFVSLTQGEKDSLARHKKEELASPRFAKLLVEIKKEILKNNNFIIWQNVAIDLVNDYWKAKQSIDFLINKKAKEEILGENWENLLRTKTIESEINQWKDHLILLIDKEKITEIELIRKLSAERIQSFFRKKQAKLKIERLREEWRNNAVARVNNYWDSNQENGKIGGKTKEEILGNSWDDIIKAKFNEDEINFERDRLIRLIDGAKVTPVNPNIALRTTAIAAVETCWNNNLASLTGKTIEGVLNANWKTGFDTLTGTAAINRERDRLTDLIEAAKNTEIITENDLKTIFSINKVSASRVNEWEEFKANQKTNKQTIAKIIADTKQNNLITITAYLQNKGVYEKDNPVFEIIDEGNENATWEKFVGNHKPEQVLKTIAACKYAGEYQNNEAKKQQLIAEIVNYDVNNQVIDKDKYGGDNFSQWTADHFIQYLYEKQLGNKFVMKDKTITVPTNKEKPFHRLDNWKMYAAYGMPSILIGVVITYWKNKINFRKKSRIFSEKSY